MNLLEIMVLLCAGGLVLYGLLYGLIRTAESSTTSHLRRRRGTASACPAGLADAGKLPGPIRTAAPPASEQHLAACGMASVANEILATSQRMQARIEALKASRITGDRIDAEALLSTPDDVARYAMLVPDRMRAKNLPDDLHRHTARLNDALHVLRALDEVLRLKGRSPQGAEEFPAHPSEAP